MIRLYGHLRGSFRTVSEGLKLAFEQLGVLDGYVIGEQQDFDDEPIGGALSPLAVVVGDPLRVLIPRTHGSHKEIWLMLAPNSEGVPPKLKNELSEKRGGRNTVDGFLAPSTWAKDVLQREFPDHPVELCQHGVLPCFKDLKPTWQRSGGTFVALHVTSTAMSRKCTKELISAWEDSKIDGVLMLSVNPDVSEHFRDFVAASTARCVVVDGQNVTYHMMAHLLSGVHLVIQPSRAEGFGLVPLEARACGTPVIATNNTGHADHVKWSPGQVVIPSRPSEESDDYWGAKAPVVTKEDIRTAIEYSYANYEELAEDAVAFSADVRHRWTWSNGALNFVTKKQGEFQ